MLKVFRIATLFNIAIALYFSQVFYYRVTPEGRNLNVDLFLDRFQTSNTQVSVVDYLDTFKNPPKIEGSNTLKYSTSYAILNASSTYRVYVFTQAEATSTNLYYKVTFESSAPFEFYLVSRKQEDFTKNLAFYKQPNILIFPNDVNVIYKPTYPSPVLSISVNGLKWYNPNNNFFVINSANIGLFKSALYPGIFNLGINDVLRKTVFVVDETGKQNEDWFSSLDILHLDDGPICMSFNKYSVKSNLTLTFDGEDAKTQQIILVAYNSDEENQLIFYKFLNNHHCARVELSYQDRGVIRSWHKTFLETNDDVAPIDYKMLIQYVSEHQDMREIQIHHFDLCASEEIPEYYSLTEEFIEDHYHWNDWCESRNETEVLIALNYTKVTEIVLAYDPRIRRHEEGKTAVVSVLPTTSYKYLSMKIIYHFSFDHSFELEKLGVVAAVCLRLHATTKEFTSEGCTTDFKPTELPYYVWCYCQRSTSFTVLFKFNDSIKLVNHQNKAILMVTSVLNYLIILVILSIQILRKSWVHFKNVVIISVNNAMFGFAFMMYSAFYEEASKCRISVLFGIFFTVSFACIIMILTARSYRSMVNTNYTKEFINKPLFILTAYVFAAFVTLIASFSSYGARHTYACGQNKGGFIGFVLPVLCLTVIPSLSIALHIFKKCSSSILSQKEMYDELKITTFFGMLTMLVTVLKLILGAIMPLNYIYSYADVLYSLSLMGWCILQYHDPRKVANTRIFSLGQNS